ncbi:Crp/Fnr family transcriptional regulator [Marinobacter zhanjiangensis]|uniref:Crp/Fnr family transcriptional regulator n=1 Tax=Marinobacter zhanjiangensis TaxID=578215 RepID=A0ABQ3AQ35_9GAMM|nr:Crp/Fnr family transcriptional regulator [Marinobacter zhanjiangensis]GGY62029.1 Crp/Fnr family transcriptional regulator [Marinobacter zhanjiangensis]
MSIARYFDGYQDIRIPAGHPMLHQGDECLHYFVLTSGSVRLFTRSASGREVTLYHVRPDDICVLTTSCLLGGRRFPAEAVADSELTVRMMPKVRFDDLMENAPGFRNAVFQSLSQRMDSLIQTIEKLALQPIDVRIANYLLSFDSDLVRTTHQLIASEVGTAREVVSRHLKQLASRGMIQPERSAIRILDPDALAKLT